MDNILRRLPDGYSSAALRHSQNSNFVFTDGHAHTIKMQAGEYSGLDLFGVPAQENDTLKWCSNSNNVPAAGFDPSGYPLQSGRETCQQAVHDFYSGLVSVNP